MFTDEEIRQLREMVYSTVKGVLAEQELERFNRQPEPLITEQPKPKKLSFYKRLVDHHEQYLIELERHSWATKGKYRKYLNITYLSSYKNIIISASDKIVHNSVFAFRMLNCHNRHIGVPAKYIEDMLKSFIAQNPIASTKDLLALFVFIAQKIQIHGIMRPIFIKNIGEIKKHIKKYKF